MWCYIETGVDKHVDVIVHRIFLGSAPISNNESCSRVCQPLFVGCPLKVVFVLTCLFPVSPNPMPGRPHDTTTYWLQIYFPSKHLLVLNSLIKPPTDAQMGLSEPVSRVSTHLACLSPRMIHADIMCPAPQTTAIRDTGRFGTSFPGEHISPPRVGASPCSASCWGVDD